MPAPPGVNNNCPPGLEYLTQIDQLLVHQQVELLEGMYTSNICQFPQIHPSPESNVLINSYLQISLVPVHCIA